MTDDELHERLRASDAASHLTPADPAWVALLLEDTMNADPSDGSTESSADQQPESRDTGTRNRSPLTWLVAAAAVLVAAVGVFILLDNDPEAEETPSASAPSATESAPPTVTELAAPPATTGRCMVPSAELLARSQVAFSGTVESVGADVVAIVPDRFYAGEPTLRVEVRAPAEQLSALVGAVRFEEGRRYLVSANDGEVTACGFSGPASPDLAALYGEAFPG